MLRSLSISPVNSVNGRAQEANRYGTETDFGSNEANRMDREAKTNRSPFSRFVPEFARGLRRRYRLARREKTRRQEFERHVRADDIFLVGHPKSGNTWLAYMLALMIRRDPDREVNISNIGNYVPVMHARDPSIVRHGHLASPRVFRNEGPRYPDLYPRTIYILRDPRSVFLSYYHHCVHDTRDASWAIGDFVDEMLEKGCIERLEPFLVRWDRQVEAWSRRSLFQPVHIVQYESLKADCVSTLAGIADFLGLDYDADLLEMTAQRGDFRSMRKEEETYGAESYPGEKGQRGYFVRRGRVDSWVEEMPADVVSRIEEAFEGPMRRYGYL